MDRNQILDIAEINFLPVIDGRAELKRLAAEHRRKSDEDYFDADSAEELILYARKIARELVNYTPGVENPLFIILLINDVDTFK